MGYTHYWTQKRSFTDDEWVEMTSDIQDILSYVENAMGIPLANARGDGGTRPEFSATRIAFNGLIDDSHETFSIERKRSRLYPDATLGADFCETARKPYDTAVTACLCYLSSVTGTHVVTSDGEGGDFVVGLDAARKAVPRKANILDIPIGIMQADRWTGPWVHMSTPSYEVYFCVDGKGYIRQCKTDSWYCFPTHVSLGEFLHRNRQATFRTGGTTSFGGYGRIEPDIWNASGSFDQARNKRLGRVQAKMLAKLFPADPEHDHRPPAFVRPGDYVRPEDDGTFFYSLDEVLKQVEAV